ncbi:DNA-binding transcriptional regulator, LysR family [Allopseudospirillum japonicum]|uniref:DNA-binding transcriptional regulator, LysR family n=1 Tax=Allopseudospirillum japonicum TaxID=64971 RepID=A0A1H6TJ46_9GAMM|nr:LysR family transcriptional regulator [Allopseudospirillum japonicum]SEI80078.1 DNA-binding transcriptional regulator, LysR family [Allopseudospirillum japonicum]
MREIFNLRQLEAFRAVVKHGSVSRAASSLFITQSAVSKLISTLEDNLEFALFERYSGRLHPTSDALKLYEQSDPVFSELSQLNHRIKQLQNKERRTFSIGVLPALASQYSAEVCKVFCENHPNIDISLFSGNTPTIKEMLINGKLDIGVISLPIDHPSFVAYPVLSSILVAVLPKEHILAKQERLHAQDLHGLDFVDYNPDDPSSALQRKLFDQFDCAPKFTINGTTASIVINLVASGFGVGLVHPASAHWRRKDLCIKPFMPETPISYYFCYDSQTYKSDLIQAFAQYMNQVYYKVFQEK